MMAVRPHSWRMRALLLRLHEGELSPAKVRSLRAHLARCPHCAQELARLERMDHLLAEARPSHRPLPPIESRVLFHEALERSGVLRRRPRRTLAWALPALGAFAVAALGGVWMAMPLLGRHSSPEPALVAEIPPRMPRIKILPGEQVDPGEAHAVAAQKSGPCAVRRIALKSRRHGRLRMYSRRQHRRWRAHRRRLEPAFEPVVQVEAPAVQEASAHLLVLVTTPAAPPAQPVVSIRKMDENAPGFARASAFLPNFFGGGRLAEYTVASNSLGK